MLKKMALVIVLCMSSLCYSMCSLVTGTGVGAAVGSIVGPPGAVVGGTFGLLCSVPGALMEIVECYAAERNTKRSTKDDVRYERKRAIEILASETYLAAIRQAVGIGTWPEITPEMLKNHQQRLTHLNNDDLKWIEQAITFLRGSQFQGFFNSLSDSEVARDNLRKVIAHIMFATQLYAYMPNAIKQAQRVKAIESFATDSQLTVVHQHAGGLYDMEYALARQVPTEALKTHQQLIEQHRQRLSKLSEEDKRYIEGVIIYLRNPLFQQFFNSLSDNEAVRDSIRRVIAHLMSGIQWLKDLSTRIRQEQQARAISDFATEVQLTVVRESAGGLYNIEGALARQVTAETLKNYQPLIKQHRQRLSKLSEENKAFIEETLLAYLREPELRKFFHLLSDNKAIRDNIRRVIANLMFGIQCLQDLSRDIREEQRAKAIADFANNEAQLAAIRKAVGMPMPLLAELKNYPELEQEYRQGLTELEANDLEAIKSCQNILKSSVFQQFLSQLSDNETVRDNICKVVAHTLFGGQVFVSMRWVIKQVQQARAIEECASKAQLAVIRQSAGGFPDIEAEVELKNHQQLIEQHRQRLSKLSEEDKRFIKGTLLTHLRELQFQQFFNSLSDNETVRDDIRRVIAHIMVGFGSFSLMGKAIDLDKTIAKCAKDSELAKIRTSVCAGVLAESYEPYALQREYEAEMRDKLSEAEQKYIEKIVNGTFKNSPYFETLFKSLADNEEVRGNLRKIITRLMLNTVSYNLFLAKQKAARDLEAKQKELQDVKTEKTRLEFSLKVKEEENQKLLEELSPLRRNVAPVLTELQNKSRELNDLKSKLRAAQEELERHRLERQQEAADRVRRKADKVASKLLQRSKDATQGN